MASLTHKTEKKPAPVNHASSSEPESATSLPEGPLDTSLPWYLATRGGGASSLAGEPPATPGVPLYLRRKPEPSASDGAPEVPLYLKQLTARSPVVVAPAGDASEREADRVAAAAERRDAPVAEENASPKTREAASLRSPPFPAATSAPLSDAVRARVEPVLGVDLGHVEVHADTASREVARDFGAKAFTHAHHIWLGPGQSADDVSLLAHEATHVVQQGAHRAPAPVQRKEAAAGDVRSVQTPPSLTPKLDAPPIAQTGAPPGLAPASLAPGLEDQGATAQPGAPLAPLNAPPPEERGAAKEAVQSVDPGEKSAKKAEVEAKLAPTLKPSLDLTEQKKAEAKEAGEATKASADEGPPARADAPGADKGAGPAAAGKPGAAGAKGAAAKAAKHAAAATDKALAMNSSAPVAAPQQVSPPRVVAPVDAGGAPLRATPGTDAYVTSLSGRVQILREQGTRLRAQAAAQGANADVVAGNIQLALGKIGESEENVGAVREHVAFRREAAGQAQGALAVSEQKASMVAEQAPGYVSKAGDSKQKTGPMASESADLTSQNAANTPDDEEAAGKSREQGEKLGKVSSDLATTDNAIGETQTRAQGLVGEAAEAKASNEQTKGKLGELDATLGATDAKVGEMAEQNAGARAQLAGVAGGPAEMHGRAAALDQRGQALIDASFSLETQLAASQEQYAAAAQRVPKRRPRVAPGGPAVMIQRAPDTTGYGDRRSVNLGSHLPSWLLGQDEPTEEARRKAQLEAEQERAADLARINAASGGQFQNLSAGDKALVALDNTGHHLFHSVASTNWAGFGLNLLRGFVDPRVGLAGVVSGLSMVLTGGANLLSGEQWAKDPLGNLLKSAADIATGIAIVLGSIALLATAITVILGAVTILTLGLASPITGPIIAFCLTVAATVGPWAITAAEVALVLQALVFIKNLIDAATASTATELETSSDRMTEDAKQAGNMAMQIGMAKVGEVGGKALGGLLERAPPVEELPPPPAPDVAPVEGAPTDAPPAAPAAPDGAPAPAPGEPAPAPTEPSTVPKAEPGGEPAKAEPTDQEPTKQEPADQEPAKQEPEAPKKGETNATRVGKEVHKKLADARRASGEWDEVNERITNADGDPIEVPRKINLKTGEPIGTDTQATQPDAVSYERGEILDDKPDGRPISKDRQEMIRNIEAYRERTGELPKKITIQRYDPQTGAPAGSESYPPEFFLPKGPKKPNGSP